MTRRSSLVYPVTHLPLLHNPLLNAIFNHPNPTKSRLNKITKLLNDHPSQFILLLPDSNSLIPFVEICHNENFVQSHIVQETGKNVYESLNGRSYTISKNVIVLLGTDLRLKLVDNELFFNFNNYMTDKFLYKIVHIDSPLDPVPILSNTESKDNEEEENSTSEIDFNQLIREFPLISERIGEIYRGFFTRLNLKEIDSTEKLIESYNSIITSGSSIFVDNLDKELIASIMTKYPELDINKSLFNYIEMNIYDKFWSQLCHLNHSNDVVINDSYETLSHISLNQVEMPDYEKLTMDELTRLEKYVNKSQVELETLSFLSSSEQQCKVLVNVFQTLASNSNTGADTLVGLLLITICRSRVSNLDSHLKYIENFSYDNQNFEKGLLGYVLSTFSAVLDYFRELKNLESLKEYSFANERIWSLFNKSTEYITVIAELQEFLNLQQDKSIPVESPVYSRNEEGESILSLAIHLDEFEVFKTIIDYETIFPMEDLLKDRNTNNLSLLGQAILMDNERVVNEIVSILFSSATEEEKYAYFNQCDDNMRNIGHILFDIDLLKEIGPYINWRQKDINNQTPFFAQLRCYDHPHYEELVKVVIGIVKSWYQTQDITFDYRDHNDLKNNTLLHIIKSELALLLESFENLNLNEFNNKNLTPLMYYTKYNRVANVHDILKDERLDLSRLDGKYYLSALDYAKIDIKLLIHNHEHANHKSTSNQDNKIIRNDKENREIEMMVDQKFIRRNFPIVGNKTFGITRIKTDNVNNDLCLFFKTLIIEDDKTEKWYTNIHNLRDFVKLLHLLKLENPHLLLSTNFVNLIPILSTQTLKINNFYKFQSQKLSILLNMINKLVLNDFYDSQILNDFLLKPGNLLERKALNNLDHLVRLNSSIEKVLDNEYIEDEIAAMRHFLNYSLEQLTDFQKNLDNLIRMRVFVNIKYEETAYIHSNFFQNFKIDSKSLPSECSALDSNLKKLKIESSHSPDNFKFIASYKLILFMCEELIDEIRKTFATKLVNWDEANRSLTRISNEINRLNLIDGKNLQQDQHRPVRRSSNIMLTPGLDDVEAPSSLSSSMDTTTTTSSSAYNSFLFSSIVQTRKSRSLRIERLMEKKSSSVKKLEILGSELKRDHELIALKLNNFLSFKKDFMKAEFKKYTENVIRDLKFGVKLLGE